MDNVISRADVMRLLDVNAMAITRLLKNDPSFPRPLPTGTRTHLFDRQAIEAFAAKTVEAA